MLNTMEALNRQIAAGVIDYEKAWSFALLEDRERRARERGPNLERKRRQFAHQRDKAKFVDGCPDMSRDVPRDTSRDVTRDDLSNREEAGNGPSRRELDGRDGLEKEVNKKMEGWVEPSAESRAPPKFPPTYSELCQMAHEVRAEHVGRTYSEQGFSYQVSLFAEFYTTVSRKTGKVPSPNRPAIQARIWMNDPKHIRESARAFPTKPVEPASVEDEEGAVRPAAEDAQGLPEKALSVAESTA
jgi:hypothetical protein